jgi:Protein of unknown function (DUF2946)
MRKRKTSSVYFVCFAALMLVAQLVITSGHIHLAGADADEIPMSAVSAPDSGSQSPDKTHPGHDGLCPLCWAQAATANLLLPSPPPIQHPAAIAFAPPVVVSRDIAPSTSPSAFNPRAPPASALA